VAAKNSRKKVQTGGSIMQSFKKALFPIALLIVSVGCATSDSKIVKGQPSDHPHYYKNIDNAGDYHVRSFMSRRSGKFCIQILNRYEEPIQLGLEKIQAETRHDGMVEKVQLAGEGYQAGIWDDEGSGASIYSKKFPWIAQKHSVEVSVWAPLPDKKTYELTFHCFAPVPLPTHSGLVN